MWPAQHTELPPLGHTEAPDGSPVPSFPCTVSPHRDSLAPMGHPSCWDGTISRPWMGNPPTSWRPVRKVCPPPAGDRFSLTLRKTKLDSGKTLRTLSSFFWTPETRFAKQKKGKFFHCSYYGFCSQVDRLKINWTHFHYCSSSQRGVWRVSGCAGGERIRSYECFLVLRPLMTANTGGARLF